jgi:hypothetical protein
MTSQVGRFLGRHYIIIRSAALQVVFYATILESKEKAMEITMRAIETTGTIDQDHRLVLDQPLPIAGPSRVRVIILVTEETDIDEQEWLRAAASNPAFDFLNDPAEDIYTLSDGKPFNDQG